MINLDVLINAVGSDVFQPEGKTVNDQDNYWPFPTSVPKKSLNDDLVKIDGLKDAQESPF